MTTRRTYFLFLYCFLCKALTADSSGRDFLQATEWYKNTVNYWPFEDVSNRISIDYTGPNNGSISGSYRSISGIVGSALALYGNESYVDFGLLSSSCLNKPSTCKTGFTIAFWLKIPDFRGNRIVLQLGEHRYSRGFTVLTRKKLTVNVGFSVNTRLRRYVWLQVWNENWNHIALIWNNRTSSLRISINCSTAQVVNTSEPAEPESKDNKASRLILGASHAMTKNIQIMVDEFAIWDQPISENTLCEIIKIHSVNGNYSEWSQFSACSVSCGNGSTKRTRTCTRPPPKDRGKDCSHLGAPEESKPCFLVPCPRNGNFSEWSVFSECSKSCGTGFKKRTRNCSNPEPKHGGRNCTSLGTAVEVRPCNTQLCPINGDYGPWSVFSECTVSCGNGTRTRKRNCTNPQPKHGGRECSKLGSSVDIQPCNVKNCPINGVYTEWTEFSKCTKSCGNGTQRRTRSCSKPEPQYDGANCSSLGRPIEVQKCNTHHCPIDGGYTQWTKFTDCSRTCGPGKKTRWRNCSNPQPRYGGRNCSHLGDPVQVEVCVLRHCPVDGGLTEWTKFSRCTKSCGVGLKNRTRYCTNPQPQHGGKDCSGKQIDFRICNTDLCSIDGGYTEWSQFSECSKTCNAGTRKRTRKCSNPAPKHGGKNCSFLGPAEENRTCNVFPCPVHGNYSSWSSFSACSKSCGNGTSQRHRNCSSPEPKHGGKNCSLLGPSKEINYCNNFPCPIDGNFSAWTIFSVCSKNCGNGTKTRTRNCTNPPPAHGGKNCSDLGPSTEVISCNTHDCSDIVFAVAVNLTSWKWNPSRKNRVIRKIKFGVDEIMGYDVNYNFSNFVFKKGSVIAEFTVILSHRDYQGITKLQDAIYVEGKIYDLQVTPVNLTSPDVPAMAPINVTASNVSSTIILLQWQTIPLNFSNGPILEYRITYIEVEGNDRKVKQKGLWEKIIDGQETMAHVTGLKKFTKYQFRMAGVNKRGVGVDSIPVTASTNQDTPSKPPSAVYVLNKTSTTVQVKWSPIPQNLVHGILLGYHIHLKNVNPAGFGVVSPDIQSVGATSTSFLMQGLLKFTEYTIQVSGYTVKGDGPLSSAVIVRTEEDVPSRPPPNVSAHNLTSTSIQVHWDPIPRRYVNGNLLGYIVSFIATFHGNLRRWNETSVNQSTTTAVITNLRKYTKYMVAVEAFTSKGSGIESKSVPVTTAEDVPDAYPTNVSGFNKSSTSLYVEWQHIPQQNKNGILKGYIITYAPTQDQLSQSITVNSARSSVTLENLKKYTYYNIRVAGFTSKGLGPYPPKVLKLQTSEDVPSRSAISVHARNTSHTSLLVEWNPIPAEYIHGVLLGYRVLFWRSNESNETYETRQTGPDVHSVRLTDLWIYTKYKIRVLGFTLAGKGSKSKEIEVSTDEFIPSQAPINLLALNKTSPTKITVRWNPIPDEFYVHGILRGYRVFYKAIATANEKLDDGVIQTRNVAVNSSTLAVVLENLSAFTRYEIEVLAFTIKGNGVRSNAIRADTCNCHRTIFTNWWINPPYSDIGGSNKSGIITPILNQAVHACCGNCTEHGYTRIDFQRSGTGRRAINSGLLEFKRNIEQTTELHFPVYGTMDQTRFSGNYGFVPFVQSPGIALIIIGDEKGTAAKLLLKSLAFCFPILFLSVALLWVSSLVMWFVETGYNQGHFPQSVLQGSWEAIWWAFASMTTLGYGDRIPRTPLGRLIGLSWILMGLVIITCFQCIMTTLLTARILNKDVMLYGTKIAAIQNSSSYRLAIRKNARVNPNGKEYANLQEVYEALQRHEVKGMLIDAFTVGSKKELFNRRDIRISKLLDYSSAYGVALGGEAKKLQKCFQKFVSEQRSEISRILQNNVDTIEVSNKSLTVERSKSLFDPSFPTYVNTVIICAVLLGIMLLVGAKFELVKKMGWIKLRRKGKQDQMLPRRLELMRNKAELKSEMSRIVAMFRINCMRRINALKQKHRRELLNLARLKRHTESELIQKGSFRRDTLFQRSLGGSRRQEHSSNGHAKQASTRTKLLADEMETIV
ncbi:uncharacterized protein LOC141886246 isoform X3 [Acropora palmata]|uniref:uncharacterized protein LOC141886246 isoform X3 n=1 Tax=Acropora palmata TaxID=6131 RepID=UPI003DA054ED